ncbi:MAG: manganese efflux pump MntP family protein [Treponema sp.]|jgi:putative Mn2+ efflux pump MntP|nr:manganese efflux pump MntP family protein [Treponema sp.]
MFSIVLIGLSLSMDALAVSISSGISIRNLRPFHALRASFFFGLFQFIMPVAGWYLGQTFTAYIAAYDHWIAFGLLAFIGGKMLKEALEPKKTAPPEGGGPEKTKTDIRSLGTLFTLALATSIDALAIGLSFSILSRDIWGPAALIGGITFAVCLTGFEFGRRIGLVFGKWAQSVGGLVLIGIGLKIVLEHLLTA